MIAVTCCYINLLLAEVYTVARVLSAGSPLVIIIGKQPATNI